MKKTILVAAVGLITLAYQAQIFDAIRFGNAESEKAHNFTGEESAVVQGAYNTTGRKLLKPETESWQSAPMRFRLKVDPAAKNYITVKFWGGDVTHDHLVMFIDNKQMGYMHLGDYDILDYEQCEPRDAPHASNPNPQYAGRFTCTTFVLPEVATKGKSEIDVAVRATGKIWGYGNNFGQFQKNVSQDSRGIYAVYIHSDPYFRPGTEVAVEPPTPRSDIPEIDLDAVKARIERELAKCLKSDPARDPWRLPLVAEAYHVPWCSAYRNPKVVEYVTAAIDALARRFVKEPEKVVTKGSWTGCGEQATALILLEDALKPVLDEEIDNGAGKTVKRRDLWCDLFEASTFQLVRDRRWLANQSQIVDNNGHRNNRAVHILDDSRGVPLEVTLKFMKEALGILPWSNGINPDLSNADPKNTPGKNYYELTKKFHSKEWGFVSNCGESTIWTSADCYEATIDRRIGKGDPEIFRTMEQAALARTIFRYPGVTVDNHPVMRLEVYIDWRNAHFPGEPSYVGKGLDLRTIYYTGNEKLLGCFKEMLADGYFQENVAASLRPGKRPDFIGLLHLPERYMEIVKKLGRVNSGMPMRGEDFVFTDEEIGVVALRNGSDVFFAELFWRARRGINNLAKIHMVTPTAEHIATIHQEQEFIPSGKFSTEPDRVVYDFRPNRFNYPGGYYRQLRAGTRIPQAEHADDQTCIGKAEFYRCSYGPYEIAMNATRRNQSYRFPVPAGNYRILPDGPTVEGGTVLEVKPGTTVVLYKQAK
ncbi:hypothetical protein [uncultured Victivallis sp.]|uniref:hypothetical protein n=1 Tax=uncultured Victivallis sp. TaxID=354118 RepID=UPI0025E64F6D|nr:hypothetical protein [uncultured Victivallis sp.]